jgi:hypothetical protein
MGLSDGAFFMIKHTPLLNGNHPISSPICPMGVADTLEQGLLELLWTVFSEEKLPSRLKLRNLQNPFHKKK